VGLWTALRIKEQQPDCDVVVLEQDICGGGASGRNGGFVLSWWPKLVTLAKLFGPEEAVRISRASEDGIHEIERFCKFHDIDADFRFGGWLWTATNRAQEGSWHNVLRLCEKMGVSPFEPITPEEVALRSGSGRHRMGVFQPQAAIVQPAALVRGLRKVALHRGVRVFEHTQVLSFTRKQPVVLCTTGGGVVIADKLVIANNAWAANIRELHRTMVVMSSDLVVTAPVPGRLEEIGWGRNRDLAITDSQTMVDYYRITRDGRVAFGKGGWTIAYGGRIGQKFDRHSRRAAEVVSDFRKYYSALADVPITHDWSGPVDRTPDSLPRLGYLGGKKHIVYGVGWSGNGVGPSVMGGRILASLALGVKDKWSEHPLVEYSAHRYPPEPIRFVGAHLVRAAVATKERAEMIGKRPPFWSVQLTKLAPSGLEDKK